MHKNVKRKNDVFFPSLHIIFGDFDQWGSECAVVAGGPVRSAGCSLGLCEKFGLSV